jgi:orotate phosphoribosyltransferase
VVELARPRRGHFDLGTGYHGDVWLDLDALFLRPSLLRPHVRWLAGRPLGQHADAVCGPMEGWAFLAQAIADVLGTAFLPAYRRPALRPGDVTAAYRLPRVPGGIGGWRVAIVDDAVNAGTAVQACFRQVRDSGAIPSPRPTCCPLARRAQWLKPPCQFPFMRPARSRARHGPQESAPSAPAAPRSRTRPPAAEHANLHRYGKRGQPASVTRQLTWEHR